MKDEVKDFIFEKTVARAKILGINDSDLNPEELALIDAGIFDSLGFIELLGELETEYSVEIDLSEFEPEYFTTLDGLAAITNKAINTSTDSNNGTVQNVVALEKVELVRLRPDLPHWENLRSLFSEMYTQFDVTGQKMALREDGDQIWLRSLNASIGKTSEIIGSIDKGQLVGFIQCSLRIPPSYYLEELVGVIDNIFLLEKYRSTGLAGELVRGAESWLGEKGITSVALQVLPGNEVGVNFWHKVGYEMELYQMRKTVS